MTDEILCFYCDGPGPTGTTVTRVCAACQARITANADAARLRKRETTPEPSEVH